MGFDFLIEDGRSSGDTLLLQEKLVPNVYHPQSVILPVKTCLPPIYMLSLQKKLVSRLFTILTQLFRRSKHVY